MSNEINVRLHDESILGAATAMAQDERSSWDRTQIILLALTVLVSGLYATGLRSTFTFVDESIYYHIAFNLRHLHAFSLDGATPTAIRPPGFPWVMMGLQAISESVRFAKTVDLMLWPLCALLMASLTRRLFGGRAATFSLLIGLLYVVELYSAGTLYPQALASLLFLASLWLEFVWSRARTTAAALLQGILWAGLALLIPVFLVNLMVYLVWLVYAKRDMRHAAVITAVVCLGLCAWSARNRAVLHGFFISDNSGEMLYYGNSEATGPNTGPQVPIWLLAPNAFAEKDEVRQENGYKQAALHWMRAHPRRAFILYLEKTANWLNCRTNLKTTTRHAALYESMIAGVFYPMLLLALCSPFLVPSRRRVETLFAMHYVMAAGAYAVFFTRIRYRLPYDYLLIMLAAASIAGYINRIQATGQTRSAPNFDVPPLAS